MTKALLWNELYKNLVLLLLFDSQNSEMVGVHFAKVRLSAQGQQIDESFCTCSLIAHLFESYLY